MIYITDDNRTLVIPKTVVAEGILALQLKNSMSAFTTSFAVADTSQNPWLYQIELTSEQAGSLPNGEYTMTLLAGTTVVGYGLMRKVKRFDADNVYSNVQPDTVYGDNMDYTYHTVSISASLGGYLIVNGQVYQTYNESVREGRILTVQAVPEEHYTFDEWSDGVEDNPRTITVTEDITLTATYEAMEYTVSISAGSNGSVTVNNVPGDFQAVLPFGTVIAIEADGDTGYEFLQWSDGNTSNPRELVVNGDITLTAAFAIGMYQVTITAGSNGTISVNNIPGNYYQSVSYGTQLVLEATPSTGFYFTQWTDGNSDNPRTITVTGPVYLSSAYAQQLFTVTVTPDPNCPVFVNGHEYTTTYTRSDVRFGENYVIEARPATGYSWSSWNDGSTTNPRILQITSNVSLTPSVTVSEYWVWITPGANGTTMVNGTAISGTYHQKHTYNSTITLQATPDTGYQFDSWGDGNTDNPRTIMVTGPVNLTSSYTIQSFNVNITAGNNGLISVNGGTATSSYSGTTTYGSTITLQATPDTGYQFDSWGDGNTDNPRTITVTSDVTLSAAFEEAVQPSALNTIKYTTTDSQVNNSWLTAYDENNNVLTPTQAGRYGRIVFGEPVYKIVVNTNDAGNINSITTGYKVQYVSTNGSTQLPNMLRLVLKSPYIERVEFTYFPNLNYIEGWYANNDAWLLDIDRVSTQGTCVTRTDNNLWEHSDLSAWTFTALGTSYTYEAQQQVDLTDHNAYNRKGGPLTPASHTFADGVGTVTYAETIGEFRDSWDGFDKVYWPDTLGYIDYSYGWTCDVELGEYAGVVGGGQYASGNWNYQNLFGGGLVPNCTVTVKETNPILTIGTDGCIYNKENWMGLNIVNMNGSTLDMDDRCVDASTCMFTEILESWPYTITRLTLGDNCESLKLYDLHNWDRGLVISELVLNDALQSFSPNRQRVGHASGGSNNPYLNVTNSGYTIESEDGTTLYWCGDASADLSDYTHFAEACCGNLSFSSMPDISSATQVDRNAFTNVSGVSTWVWPNNTVTFNGSHCLKSYDVTRMEFGTHAPLFNNNEWESIFQLGNISTLVFNSTTIPTQTDQYKSLFQELPQSGTIYIPAGSDYSTFLNYDGNIGNIGQWTVKYIMDNTQLAIKHTPGVTITAPTITGLNMRASEDSGGWLKVTYDNDIVTYNSTSLQGNADVLEVVLPDSCLSVGNGAFLGCSNLAKVAVGDSCTSIGNSAFYGTAITEFSAKGVTSFGSGAFGNCASLTSVEFGENLATLGEDLFDNCSSLEYVGFEGATGPTITNNDLGSGIHATGTMYIPRYANDASYADFIAAMPVGWTVIRRKQNQILYQTTDGQQINVPSEINGSPLIKHIYFNGWGVIEYAGTRLYRIPEYGFSNNSNLSALYIPSIAANIGSNAFENCGNLTTVEIQDCTDIDWNVFNASPIVNGPDTGKLTLPPSVGYIWGGAFANLESSVIEFGPALHSIDADTFNLQNATDLYVYTTRTMEDHGNPFTNVPASGTLHMVPGADTAYWTKYLPGWTVANDLSVITYTTNNSKKIEPLASAFNMPLVYNSYDSNGKGTLAFNGLLTTIDSNAFNGCTNLSTVAIPVTVTSVSNNAFNYTALTGFKIENGPDGNSVNDGVYYSKYGSIERNGLFMANTRTDSGGTHRADLLIVGTTKVSQTNEVYYVDTRAFKGNRALTSYTFGGCIEQIRTEAFMDCSNLSTIRLGSNNHTAFGGSRDIYTDQFTHVASTGTLYGKSGKDYSWLAGKLASGWTISQ